MLFPAYLLLWGCLGHEPLEGCLSSSLAKHPIFQVRVTYPVSSSPLTCHPHSCLLAASFVSLLTIHCISDLVIRVSGCRSLREVTGLRLWLLFLKMSSAAASPLCPSCFYVPLCAEPFPGTSTSAMVAACFSCPDVVPRRAPCGTIKVWGGLGQALMPSRRGFSVWRLWAS